MPDPHPYRSPGRDRDATARWFLEPVLMMDLVYVVLTAGLLTVSWALVRLCERV